MNQQSMQYLERHVKSQGSSLCCQFEVTTKGRYKIGLVYNASTALSALTLLSVQLEGDTSCCLHRSKNNTVEQVSESNGKTQYT